MKSAIAGIFHVSPRVFHIVRRRDADVPADLQRERALRIVERDAKHIWHHADDLVDAENRDAERAANVPNGGPGG